MGKADKKTPVVEEETRLEYMDAQLLSPWSRNPKQHDFKQITASMKRFGFTAPPLLDEATQRLIAGHGRVEGLLQLKAAGMPAPRKVIARMVLIDGVQTERWFIPVIRGLTFKNEQEADAYLIADNRLTELGGWDDTMLRTMLEELKGSTDELAGVGYDLSELEEIANGVDPEPSAADAEPKEKLENFLTAKTKQIIIFLEPDEYDAVIERMTSAMQHLGVQSHSEVLLKLLAALETQYEA